MPDRFTAEEFNKLMSSWDPAMRSVAEGRMQTNYTREQLAHFTDLEAVTLRALLKRLIPEDEGVDLVGFLDWACARPLGRGDRRPGVPAEPELFKAGLAGLNELAQKRHNGLFHELFGAQQDAIIEDVTRDRAEGESFSAFPSSYFFERIYAKALFGYFAHPRVWMRIGFMGASYPEGYTWLSQPTVEQRHERAVGWDFL